MCSTELRNGHHLKRTLLDFICKLQSSMKPLSYRNGAMREMDQIAVNIWTSLPFLISMLLLCIIYSQMLQNETPQCREVSRFSIVEHFTFLCDDTKLTTVPQGIVGKVLNNAPVLIKLDLVTLDYHFNHAVMQMLIASLAHHLFL